MEILILLLVSPAIFAQRYRKHANPNDEPFLPIHPVYPYNLKLTKRGFDNEITTVLKPELYAPRADARNSYTGSYTGSPRDSYSSGYSSPPHSSAAPYSPYSSYYDNSLYGVYMNPYTANPYGSYPYTSGAHGSGSYPGYYPQTPYYYPNYYSQLFPHSFPPPNHSGPPGPPGRPWSESSNLNDGYLSEKYENPKPSKPKTKENSSSSTNGSGNQYMDGKNFISQNSKDLMAQSSAYKTPNPYNQLEQIADLHFKNVPVPPPTYKVISVGGQLVGPNYPLPNIYARAQLLEQAVAMKNLAKSLEHLFPHQVTRTQGSQGVPSYLPYATAVGDQGSKLDQDKFYGLDQRPVGKIREGQYYSENLNAPGKSVETHVYGSVDRDLPDKESNNQFLTAKQDSSAKFNDAQTYTNRQNNQNTAPTEYAISQADKSEETFAQHPASLIKIPSKYQNLPYTQKSGTRVTFQRSQSAYIPPGKTEPVLEEADSSSVQSYDRPSLSYSVPYRSEKNYHPDQTQGVVSYQNQNLGQGTPQAYTYHRTNILPFVQGSQQRQQHQEPKTNLEDVNFDAKQGNKG